jgi:hypothetical protein
MGTSIFHIPPMHVAFSVCGGHPGGSTVYVHEDGESHGAPAMGSSAGQGGGMHGVL